MSIATDTLWNLVVDAQLVSADARTKLAAEFSQELNGDSADSDRLSKWLIGRGAISRYQANILLAGQAGPFVYGDYQIYERIESGRLAGIFRAIHVPTRHRVCLMFLTGEAVQNAQVVEKLAQRAALTNRLSQGFPHLLRCYHLADLGTYKFLVVEDLLGRRVERYLNKHGAMKPREACRIARQAALALARLHALSVVHGDVRPATLWMDQAGPVKLVQFPLIRDPLAAPFSAKTAAPGKDGRTPVELDYLAPELIGGDAQPDARSDLYALGCTLYQMLANQVPFPGGTIEQKLARIANDTPQPLAELNPAVTPELAKLVGYMMHKNPDLRFQQMTSVVERLMPHMAPEDAHSPVPAPSKSAKRYDVWLQEFYKASGIKLPSMSTKPPADLAKPAPAAAQPEAKPAAPAATQPVAAQPVAAQPVAAPPMAAQPVAPQPMVAQAVPAQPMPAQPVMAQAMPAQPVAAQPMLAQPAVAQPAAMPGVAAPVGMVGGPSTGGSSASTLAAMARARRRRQQVQQMIVAVVILVAAIGGGIYFYLNPLTIERPTVAQPPTTPTPPDVAVPTMVAPLDATETDRPAVAATETSGSKSDEGISNLNDPVWTSPTAGQPLELRYLPLGVQGLISLRPSEILDHPLADRLLDPEKLGLLAGWITGELPQLASMPAENIELVTIGLLPDASTTPRISLVVRTFEPLDTTALLNQWGNPAPQTAGEQEFYNVADRSYYLPPAGEGRLLVMTPAGEMSDVVMMAGNPAPLPPQLEFLAATSDQDRLLNVLLMTKFLESGGQGMLFGPGERLRNPLHWFLTGHFPGQPGGAAAAADMEPPRALLASVHLNDDLFVELRLFDPNTSTQQPQLAQAFRERVAAIPRGVDRYNRGLLITPYSFDLLYEFPEWLKLVDQYTRAAVVDKQVVLRLVLPAELAQYLALGSYLSLVENPRDMQAVAAAGSSTAAPAAAPQTVEQKLQKKIDLSFDRNTLEVAMELIGQEIGAEIIILGGDLQLEGITRNQSFGLDERGKTASEILQVIFKKANPDGKLVYVIKPKEGGGDEVVYVTTRAAVANRGDKLPPEFQQ